MKLFANVPSSCQKDVLVALGGQYVLEAKASKIARSLWLRLETIQEVLRKDLLKAGDNTSIEAALTRLDVGLDRLQAECLVAKNALSGYVPLSAKAEEVLRASETFRVKATDAALRRQRDLDAAAARRRAADLRKAEAFVAGIGPAATVVTSNGFRWSK